MTQKNFIFYSTVSKPTAPVKTQQELNKEQMAEALKAYREEVDNESDSDSDVEDSPTTSTFNFQEMFSDTDEDDDDNYQLETPPQSESDTEDIYTPPVSDNEEEVKEEVKFINPFDDPSLFTAEINKDNTYNPFDEFDVKPVSPPPLKLPEETPRGRLALIREKKRNKENKENPPPLGLCQPQNNNDILIKRINKNSYILNKLYKKYDDRPGKSDKTRTCRMIRQILNKPDQLSGQEIFNLKRFYEEQEIRIKSYENDGEELNRLHKRDIKNDKRNKSYEYLIPLKDYELWIQDSSF